jgi:hypothetical protein
MAADEIEQMRSGMRRSANEQHRARKSGIQGSRTTTAIAAVFFRHAPIHMG